MIRPLFRRRSSGRNIDALYGAIVAQARSRAFYVGCGVPDTVDGRFDLIVLHLILLLRRLESGDNGRTRTAGGTMGRLDQRLFDVFCRDLDHNLREMGTGDLAVPRRMRGFGEAFYGRQAAYRAALAVSEDERELETALARNIFGSAAPDQRAAQLARYVRAVVRQLEIQDEGLLIAGKVAFPNFEAYADERH